MALTMLEASGALGWFSAALLFAAVTAWVKLGPGPMLQKLDGSKTFNTNKIESASRLLFIALGVSLVAAIVAVVGWIFG
jgi:hypothetical protein